MSSDFGDALAHAFIRLSEELETAKKLIETLQAENTALAQENEKLRNENTRLAQALGDTGL